MDSLARLFLGEELSEGYAKRRLPYCEELFQIIVDYCKETNQKLDLAVDVGCGPGNSTVPLCKYFKKVIGVDISPAMLDAAPKDIPNCEFKLCPAQHLTFLKGECVDLFSSALSFYLMPQEKVLAEADRVLKPGGTLAIFGHGRPKTLDSGLRELFYQEDEMYFAKLPQCFCSITNLYKDVELPYPGWRRLEGPRLNTKFNLEDIRGRWKMCQHHLIEAGPPEEKDGRYTKFMENMLNEKLPGIDPYREFEVYFETFIILGHKPLK